MLTRQSANAAKLTRRATASERRVALGISLSILSLFAGLWVLQRRGFDFGLLFNPCGFRQRTGWPCPACGMTTSVLAFARGQLLDAFYIQPAAAFLCSALVLTAFLAFLTAVVGVYFWVFDRLLYETKVTYWIVGLLVVLAAGWAVTLARAFAAQSTG
jgi:hypothetical protein